MSRQYKNITAYLEPHAFKVMTTEDEYASMEKKMITIKCPCDHSFTMTSDSFNNKKREFTKKDLPMDSFCFKCYDAKDRIESTQKHIKTIKERTGHEVLEIDITSRKIVYKCCNCNEINHSYIQNLTSQNKGHCGYCERKRS
jgi:hypothetical protein